MRSEIYSEIRHFDVARCTKMPRMQNALSNWLPRFHNRNDNLFILSRRHLQFYRADLSLELVVLEASSFKWSPRTFLRSFSVHRPSESVQGCLLHDDLYQKITICCSYDTIVDTPVICQNLSYFIHNCTARTKKCRKRPIRNSIVPFSGISLPRIKVW